MRCKEMQRMAWENSQPGPNGGARLASPLEAAALRHLEGCARCQSYLKDLQALQAGFGVLARDAAPDPSWGFSDRVLRRLNEEKARKAPAPEFLESVGRRVILATLILVFTLLLAMILPSSGPVRHEPTMESYWSQTESVTATAASYPVDWSGSVPPVPVLVTPAAYHENQ
ncbi:MAG: hypothetical protein ACRD19_12095 [Terriglobia bacterium]